MDFVIVIYASDLKLFSEARSKLIKFASYNIVYCNSNQFSRAEMLKLYPEQWLLFLDADCELNPKTFNWLAENRKTFNKQVVYVGYYADPKDATYLQKTHNYIANNWLQSQFLNQAPGGLLGGLFLIYSQASIDFSESEKTVFWGAEDKFLAQSLRQKAYAFEFKAELNVIHHTSSQIKHFIRRAWLHGINDVLYLNERFKIKIRKPHFIYFQNLNKSNWILSPAIVLHFLIQKFGKIIQSLRRPCKLKLS